MNRAECNVLSAESSAAVFTHHSSLITHHCVVVGLLVAMLGGCGTVPKRDTASKAPPATTRPGGYYLDDGPGASPPADLSSIPDAVPRPEPLHRGASRPYVVMGRSYAPMTSLQPYRARGVATWYGRRYHGKQTSSGEPYDMYAMTAAHTTLPIPSYARVTNLANGRSVVVRINDRGPFVEDRLIDLSYTAAHKLGVLAGGSALVEVETIIPGSGDMVVASRSPAPPATGDPMLMAPASPLPEADTPPAVARPVAATDASASAPLTAAGTPFAAVPPQLPVAAEGGRVYLQLGAFGSKENAESFLARMKAQMDWLSAALHVFTRDGLFRVHAGPYASQAEARGVADRIGEALGVKPFVLTR